MIHSDWNRILLTMPDPHLLQTRQWAELKSRYGWTPHPFVWMRSGKGYRMAGFEPGREDQVQAAAMVLERELPLGLRMMYVPKGPLLLDWKNSDLRSRVRRDLVEFAKAKGSAAIKIDPDVLLGTGVPGAESAREIALGRSFEEELRDGGWNFSQDQIQYRNTILIDLTPEEDDLLMNMKSKTRYNIRLAGRKGVKVRTGGAEDLDRLYAMYAKTSLRAGFSIRGEAYYRDLWELFLPGEQPDDCEPAAEPLIAEVDQEPVAGAMMFRFGPTAYYLHGMSRSAHREKMPTYLIQWEAMRWARQAGCTEYDMWGAPDEFSKDDPMWGVYRFKRGFGGQVRRTIGAWDYPVRPLFYRAYTDLWPRVMDFWRKLRDWKTAENAAS